MVFKDTKIYSNLQTYCNYYKKDFEDCFYNLKKREQEAIMRGNISDRLVETISLKLRISQKEMDFMLKYDLTDEECRWNFFCGYLDTYSKKMEDLEFEIGTRQFCFENLLKGIKEERYLKLVNSFDIYECGGLEIVQEDDDKIKFQFFTLNYIKAYLIINRKGEEINPECEIYICIPYIENKKILFKDEPRYEFDMNSWDNYSIELLKEIIGLCPNHEYYFTLSIKKLLNSEYQYSLKKMLGIPLFD